MDKLSTFFAGRGSFKSVAGSLRVGPDAIILSKFIFYVVLSAKKSSSYESSVVNLTYDVVIELSVLLKFDYLMFGFGKLFEVIYADLNSSLCMI